MAQHLKGHSIIAVEFVKFDRLKKVHIGGQFATHTVCGLNFRQFPGLRLYSDVTAGPRKTDNEPLCGTCAKHTVKHFPTYAKGKHAAS